MDIAAAGSDLERLLSRPAIELAALVRAGEVRSRELVEAALRRIEANAHLNAFTLVDADGALAAADAVRPGDPRPFAGVPIAIKELTPVAGHRWTMGSDLFADHRAPTDAYVVRRLRDAGFILVGRTASPEFGLVPVTEPRRFGPTRNPWNPARTPGGSSGGAAAAVAAGILPVAHGSDGGGSIRIPAACCGLVGLKPSRGRISAGPGLGDQLLSTNGALTRTVADSAHLLDVMSGYEVGDATWAPPPPEPFAAAAARPPRPLRIAVTTDPPIATEVHPLAIRATHAAARLLESLGHTVEAAAPPEWQPGTLLDSFGVLWAANIAANVRLGGSIRGRPPQPTDVERLTWAFYQRGSAAGAVDYVDTLVALQGYARRLIGFFSAYDALLTPSLALRPLPIGTLDTEGEDAEAEFGKAAAFTPFTPTFNITGQPAISLPLYVGDDGLPLGVQIAGPPVGEGLLLALAAQIEAAHAWNSPLPRAAR